MATQVKDLGNPAGLLQGRGLLIGGELLREASGGIHAHVNPATGEVQAEIPLAGPKEVDAAVASARAALAEWRTVPANEKTNILLRFSDLMVAHQDEIALLAAQESGVPVSGGGGVGLALHWMRYYAGWCDKIEGQVVTTYPVTGLNYVLSEPYGVIAAIIPWNMPSVAISMKVLPALAAGNTVVLKPPEITPFVALRMGELAIEAGLPKGAFNIVPGTGEAGAALCRHPGVDKITFTGGGATAKLVMAGAAETLKPVAMELGGKSANLIFDDANLDVAVPVSVGGCMGLTGQGCVNPTRMLVQESVYDEVIDRVTAIVESFKLGNPLDTQTTMGPVISEAACQRILGVIDRAKQEQAGKLIIGGERAGGELAKGAFVCPTVFGEVKHESHLAQEEVFGPVLSITRFSDEKDGFTKANANQYGLGAYVHTHDLERAHRAAAQLEAGGVYINGPAAMSPTMPFGGVKQSGFGREGGRAGLEEFLRPKNVLISMQMN